LIEFTVRILGLANHLITDPAYEASSDPKVIYRYKTNYVGFVHGPTDVKTNSFGCRDREYNLDKPIGTIRIVVMGDSVTFGQGVKSEEVFTEVLESSLGERFNTKMIEIINFGVQGYTIKNQVARFRAEAISLNPDIAILAPISDDLSKTREINFVDKEGFLTKRGVAPSRLKKYLRRSYAAYFIKDLIYKNIVVNTKTFKNLSINSDNLGDALSRLEQEVEYFCYLCNANGIIPIFALLDLETNALTQAIVARLQGKFEDLIIIDCSPLYGNNGWSKFGIPKDGHPNAEAHQIIARALADKLAEIIPIIDTTSQ